MTAKQLTVLVSSARFIPARFGAEICHRRLGGRRARRLPRIAGWTPGGDRVLATTSVGWSAYTQAGRRKSKRNELCDSGRLASAHLESRGGRRQVSLGLVTMAETIQKEMSCFPGETGSSRIFDNKTVQGLDKRRRSKQKGLDTKGNSSSPGPTYPPQSHDQPNTPQCNQPLPPQGPLCVCAVGDGDAYDKKTRSHGSPHRFPLPSACLVQQHLSPFALSKRHNADSSRRGPAGDNLCASSPFARKHPYPDYSRYRRFDFALANAGYIAISRPTGGSLPPTAMR